MNLTNEYWQNRYEQGQTQWDAGAITTPLKEYIDQLRDIHQRILIPGAGNGYEAEYLFGLGYENVFVLDIARAPLENVQQRMPDFPSDQLIEEDFFSHQGPYDLILEQTFYCAIDPGRRDDYVVQAHKLLRPGGKLVGLLWDAPMFSDRPPYGGSLEEYQERFGPFFEIDILEKCYNSIPPRAGTEAFVKFIRK